MSGDQTVKMDVDWTNIFINTIVKNIQTVCSGLIPFNENIEVVGSLHLNIDSDKKISYIVNEKCCKEDVYMQSTSNSFHAEPKSDKPKRPRSVVKSRKKKATSPLVTPSKMMKFESFEDNSLHEEILDDISVDSSLGVTFTEHDSSEKNISEETFQSIQNLNDALKSQLKKESETGEGDQNVPTEQGASSSTIPVTQYYFDPETSATMCVDVSGDKESMGLLYSDNGGTIEGEATLDEGTNESVLDSTNDIESSFGEPSEYAVTDDNIRLLRTVNNEKIRENEVEYTIVEMGTKQGKPMLVDSIGYRYTLRKQTDACARWWCSKRSKRRRCPAAVAQRGDIYTRGFHEHVHDAEPNLLTSTIIRAEARNQALNDQFTPPTEVLERALSVKGCNNDESFLPKEDSLLRMINYCRKDKKPKKTITETQPESEHELKPKIEHTLT